MGKAVVFILASETNLQMLSALSKQLREKYRITTIAINRRLYDLHNDYAPGTLDALFDKVYNLVPLAMHFTPPSLPKRIINKIVGLFKPNNESLELQRLQETVGEIVGNHEVIGAYFSNDKYFPDRDLIVMMKEKKIPTVLMQESIRRDFASSSKQDNRMNGQGGCDYVIAWGETSIDYYQKVGVERSKILPLGNPRIDAFFSKAQKRTKEDAKKALKLPAESRMYFIGSNPIYGMMLENSMTKMEYIISTYRTVETILRQSPANWVFIKPHLIEMSFWQDIKFEEYFEGNDRVVISHSNDLTDLILAAEKVLVYNSTVALEAAILGRASAVLNYYNKNHGCDFIETGLSMEITNETDLLTFVTNQEAHLPQSYSQYIAEIDDNCERYLQVLKL